MTLIRCQTHPSMRHPSTQPGCFLCDDGTALNVCLKDQPHEIVGEHLPGQPTFRTRGQRDRYFKRHGLVAYGKSDLSSLKTGLARAGGRGKPVHNLKQWWQKEASKYRGLVNQPAFTSR